MSLSSKYIFIQKKKEKDRMRERDRRSEREREERKRDRLIYLKELAHEIWGLTKLMSAEQTSRMDVGQSQSCSLESGNRIPDNCYCLLCEAIVGIAETLGERKRQSAERDRFSGSLGAL